MKRAFIKNGLLLAAAFVVVGGVMAAPALTLAATENTGAPIKVSGQKFNDLDGDGEWNAGEPTLAGIEICGLNLVTGEEHCVLTNEDGGYAFHDVSLDDCIIYEKNVPAGWEQTAPDGGQCLIENPEPGREYYCDFGNTEIAVEPEPEPEGQCSLAITKEVDIDSIAVNQTTELEYSFTITNTSDVDCTWVELYDYLPEGVTTPETSPIDGRPIWVVQDDATFAPGEVWSYTMPASASPTVCEPLVNTAYATSPDTPLYGGDTGTATVNVTGCDVDPEPTGVCTLALTKDVNIDSVNVNETTAVEYSFTITNTSDVVCENVELYDYLPAGVVATTPGAPVDDTPILAEMSFGPGAEWSYTMNADVSPTTCDSLVNTAYATSPDTALYGGGEDTATITVTGCDVTPEPTVSSSTGSTSRGGSSRSGTRNSSNDLAAAPVAPTAAAVLAPSATCNGFDTYMRPGDESLEVLKLQLFLYTRGYEVNVTSVYDVSTVAAVKQWQLANAQYILTPWEITEPTGLFLQSSRAFANHLMGCRESSVELNCPASGVHANWIVPVGAAENMTMMTN